LHSKKHFRSFAADNIHSDKYRSKSSGASKTKKKRQQKEERAIFFSENAGEALLCWRLARRSVVECRRVEVGMTGGHGAKAVKWGTVEGRNAGVGSKSGRQK